MVAAVGPRARERREKLRHFLVTVRRKRGLTQTVVAQRLGKLQACVSRFESGDRQLEVGELFELAEILEFDLHDLVNELAG